jgi:hypothetical protein
VSKLGSDPTSRQYHRKPAWPYVGAEITLLETDPPGKRGLTIFQDLEFIKCRVVRNILEDHLYWCITTQFLQRAPDDVTYETRTFIQLYQCHCVGDLRFKSLMIDPVIDSE